MRPVAGIHESWLTVPVETPNVPTMYRKHQVVQLAARKVLEELIKEIDPNSTECSIAAFTSNRLSESGFPETWYHSCQSLVLAGNRSCLSISGREYIR